MYTTPPDVPEYRVRLTDFAIAKLLGLSLEEYGQLNHRPIEAFTDSQGNITEFYIRVSSNNSPRLLNKLNLDDSNFVRFDPKRVFKMYV